MNLDCHSDIIGQIRNKTFRESMEAFATELIEKDKKIKKVQLYSDFFDNELKYPFVDEVYVYYPLTLIYASKKWETRWVRWKKVDVQGETKLQLPEKETVEFFNPFWALCPLKIEFCNKVPECLIELVKHKELVHFQNKFYASPEISNWEAYIGKINISFLDELCRQISRQLIDLMGTNLSAKWSIAICGERYYECGNNCIKVELKNQNAHSMSFIVGWREPFDTCDYIAKNEIKFFLCGYSNETDLDQLKTFIQNGGYVYLTDSENASDVMINIHFKDLIDDLKLEAIMKLIEDFVYEWNTEKTPEDSQEKIHDAFLYEREDSYMSIYIDFCVPDCLNLLKKYIVDNILNNSLFNIKTIKINNENMYKVCF